MVQRVSKEGLRKPMSCFYEGKCDNTWRDLATTSEHLHQQEERQRLSVCGSSHTPQTNVDDQSAAFFFWSSVKAIWVMCNVFSGCNMQHLQWKWIIGSKTSAGLHKDLSTLFSTSHCFLSASPSNDESSQPLKLIAVCTTKEILHHEDFLLAVYRLRRQGVGCEAETGRREARDLGIFFVLTQQFN